MLEEGPSRNDMALPFGCCVNFPHGPQVGRSLPLGLPLASLLRWLRCYFGRAAILQAVLSGQDIATLPRIHTVSAEPYQCVLLAVPSGHCETT